MGSWRDRNHQNVIPRARDLASLPRPDLWADPGPRGSADYLPNVRQGDITLLNTKADRFAPFVRRVGMRVFQTFSMEFKHSLSRRSTRGACRKGERTSRSKR